MTGRPKTDRQLTAGEGVLRIFYGLCGVEGRREIRKNIFIQVKSSSSPSPLPQEIYNDRSLNSVLHLLQLHPLRNIRDWGNEIFRNRY